MKIDLNKAERLQTLKGWGTSACWWAQSVSDEKTQEELAELLYGDSGLKLNIYRYNIGGGYDGELNRVENPWRRTESFMLYDRESEERSWDFSRDKNAVSVMRKCLDKGNIDTLILFCNSPHYSLCSSGQASGSLLGHTCNIPKMNYKKFVDYVLDITQHFLDTGFPVNYISPINEPQWKWGGSYVWQEGCHYELDEVVEIYRLFAAEILRRKMPVFLYGPESGAMLEDTPDYLNALAGDELIMKVLPIFAYHSYHADERPEDRYEFKEKLVKAHPELRFDMSEWCELPNKSHTKNFNGALITARIIGQDIIYGGAESWTSWVAANNIHIKEDGFDYSDAMLSGNIDFTEWTVNERFWGVSHFSKHIPVGSVPLDFGFRPTKDNNEFNAFAFKTPDGDTVIVAVNEGKNNEIEIDGNFNTMSIIMSTQDEKEKTVFEGGFKSKISVPENSVITVLLKE